MNTPQRHAPMTMRKSSVNTVVASITLLASIRLPRVYAGDIIMNIRREAFRFALLLAAGLSQASATQALSARDSDFLGKATTAGIKEVELSRVAQTHALDTRVRAFADAMVIQHGGANDALKKL